MQILIGVGPRRGYQLKARRRGSALELSYTIVFHIRRGLLPHLFCSLIEAVGGPSNLCGLHWPLPLGRRVSPTLLILTAVPGSG